MTTTASVSSRDNLRNAGKGLWCKANRARDCSRVVVDIQKLLLSGTVVPVDPSHPRTRREGDRAAPRGLPNPRVSLPPPGGTAETPVTRFQSVPGHQGGGGRASGAFMLDDTRARSN